MLDEASKIWEVVRKSVGSTSQEVARKFYADFYHTGLIYTINDLSVVGVVGVVSIVGVVGVGVYNK